MVAKFNGKTPSAGKANKPSGAPVKHSVKKIESAASKAKATGGTASTTNN